MVEKNKLLTPEDKIIKKRIAQKSRTRMSLKQYSNKIARLLETFDCNHTSVLFHTEDFTFRCKKCKKKLIRLSGKNEFRLFCELSGKDPKNFMA